MGIGAMATVMLKLPMTATLLATLLLSSDGLNVVPVVIVAVVVAYVASRLATADTGGDRPPPPPGRPDPPKRRDRPGPPPVARRAPARSAEHARLPDRCRDAFGDQAANSDREAWPSST